MTMRGDQHGSRTLNIEVVIIGNMPGEVETKEPLNNSHGVHWNESGEDGLEFGFHIVISREQEKFVNIETKRDRNQGGSIRRVGRVMDADRIDTGESLALGRRPME